MLDCDVTRETVLSMTQAAALIPSGAKGRARIHPRTLANWIERGKDGIHLEGVYSPGGWLTSQEALGRFFERLTKNRLEKVRERRPAPETPVVNAQPRLSLAEVEAMLDQEGLR